VTSRSLRKRISWRRVVLRALPPLIVALALPPPALAASAPIALDPSFGSGGVVSAGDSIPNFQEAAALAIAPNEDILVAGEGNYSPGGVTVVRYQPDGALDRGFGGGTGYVQVPGASGANALAVDEAGGAVLLSQRTTITRITAGGELDASFGVGGSVQPSQLGPSFTSLHFWSAAALPDGGILAAGIRFGSPRMVVVRLLPDGSLDRSFGEGGLVTLGFGRTRNSGALQMAVQSNGDIVLGGYAHAAPALARLLPDGAPDPSFGHNGRVGAPRGLRGQVTAIATRPDGRILVAGTGWRTGSSGPEDLLLRYGLDGTLDRSFGTAAASIGSRGGSANPVAVLPTPRHIFVVTEGHGPAIHAYRPNGQLAGSLGQVAGVPQDRFFGTAAALQRGKVVLVWTPKHRSDEGVIDLERFAVR
jgi:uncharacterized delta-60 repeat protein